MKEAGETYSIVIGWLFSMGISISERPLRSHFSKWGLINPTPTALTIEHTLFRNSLGEQGSTETVTARRRFFETTDIISGGGTGGEDL
jgi:hypothetical protein